MRYVMAFGFRLIRGLGSRVVRRAGAALAVVSAAEAGFSVRAGPQEWRQPSSEGPLALVKTEGAAHLRPSWGTCGGRGSPVSARGSEGITTVDSAAPAP